MTSEMHSMARTRDPLEIEGALLPPEIPVATAVTEDAATQATSTAVAAVPLTHFDYDNTTQEATDEAEDQDIPTAPFLPPYDDSQSRVLKESLAVARGKQSGRIEAEQERVEIERANRKINAIEWHTKRTIEEAKKEAKRHHAEGVQIREDKWFGNEEKEEQDEKPDPDAATYTVGGGGYEVAEYETSDYKGYEYETTEYKSVYDP